MHGKWSFKPLAVTGVILALIAFVALTLTVGPLSTRAATPLYTVASPASGGTALPQQSYADVVAHVAPAVVTIRAAHRVRQAQQYPYLNDPFFQQFFGNQLRNAPQQQPEVEHDLGSGVIVGADGNILTNHHVVDGAEQISVELTDRRTFTAKVVGSDAPSDLALLKIQADNLPVLSLGDSDKVRIGDVCLAVGNPLGIGQTVTMGIISARGRATGLSNGSFENFLQTDAAINRGNSGGALVNTRGELIGINSQILSPSGGSIGIGFAIPSDMARNVMDQLSKNGKVRRGRLGVEIQDINSDLAQSLGLKEVRGVLVSSVVPAGPASASGLKSGDVITAVNGKNVEDANELRNEIASTAPGTDVALTVVRNGQQQEIHAKLGELQPGQETGNDNGGANSGEHGKLGVTVRPLTQDEASQLHLNHGATGLVVTDVSPTGPAANAGIQQGDVILEVNHQPVKSVDDLQSALAKSGTRPALLLISRNGNNLFVAVQPK